MIAVDCPVCEGARRTVLFPANFDASRMDGGMFAVKGRSRAPHYQINRCSDCSMVYSSRLLEPAALARLYREFPHENTGEHDYLAFRSATAAGTYAREHSSAAVDWAAVRTMAAAAKNKKKK